MKPFHMPGPFSMQGGPFHQGGGPFHQQQGGGPYYDFRDEFTSVKASAAINNSVCEPGPGNRTLVDTETCVSIIPNYGSSLADQTGVTFGGANNACVYTAGAAVFDYPTGFNATTHANLGRIVVQYDSNGRAAWGFIGDVSGATGVKIYSDASLTVQNWHCPSAFLKNTGAAYTFNIYQPTSGGKLFFQGGKATAANGDPGLWDATAITRTAGLICAFKVNPKDISKVIGVGLDTDKTGTLAANAMRISSSTVIPYANDTAGPAIAVPANATEHIMAIVLRAAGAKYFMKVGTGNFKKLWETGTNNTATLYRGISNYSLTGKVDFIRQSKTLWMDTPLLSDSFTGSAGSNDGRLSDGLGHAETTGLGSGGSGVAWSGASGAVDGSGRLVITPTLGAELVVDGDFESANLSNWGDYLTYALAEKNATTPIDGLKDFHLISGTTTGGKAQTIGGLGGWYRSSCIQRGQIAYVMGIGSFTYIISTSSTIYASNTNILKTNRITSGSGYNLYLASVSNREGWMDDVSLKQITLSTCFNTATLSTKDIMLKTAFQMQTGLQCGVVLGLSADGNSFIIAYHDGAGNIKLEICEAGTYTTKATVAIAYSSDAELVVRRDNKEIWVWYGGVLIGAGPTTTLSDSENSNLSGLKAGLFSTDSANTFSYANVFYTGTNGEYGRLDYLVGN